MAEPVVVEFEFTGEHVFRAKMLHWRRRSVPRYLVAAGLVAVGLMSAGADARSGFAVFALIGLSLVGISASVIGISTELLVKRRREAGRERVRLSFGDRIELDDGEHVSKEWSWITQVLRTKDTLALRTRDGVFRNVYFFLARTSPQHAALDALLSERGK
ncbi:MAG TPA: hypothetical protein VFX59_13400 [Polyangiales bacterium]|nr:hypothetical protein [Polyangiales bacterium]